MRRLIAIAALALVAACEAPVNDEPAPAAEAPSNPDAFRAETGSEPPAYAGEWAASSDACNDQKQIWTIEEHRMGARRERFCVFERVFASGGNAGKGWSASARCLSDGQQSQDFMFFRVGPSQLQMRVTINDAEVVELVRCPMTT